MSPPPQSVVATIITMGSLWKEENFSAYECVTAPDVQLSTDFDDGATQKIRGN